MQALSGQEGVLPLSWCFFCGCVLVEGGRVLGFEGGHAWMGRERQRHKEKEVLLWWCSIWESACPQWGHGFNPWSRSWDPACSRAPKAVHCKCWSPKHHGEDLVQPHTCAHTHTRTHTHTEKEKDRHPYFYLKYHPLWLWSKAPAHWEGQREFFTHCLTVTPTNLFKRI